MAKEIKLNSKHATNSGIYFYEFGYLGAYEKCLLLHYDKEYLSDIKYIRKVITYLLCWQNSYWMSGVFQNYSLKYFVSL